MVSRETVMMAVTALGLVGLALGLVGLALAEWVRRRRDRGA